MKPTIEFSENMLDNTDKFQDDFFKRFNQRHADQPLQLNDKISKNYLFPTFYGDVTCAIAVFMCNYEKARAIMPHPDLKPVKMTQGRALVTFSCYVYKNVLNIPPYNEIAMTIPVMADPNINVPILPMIMDSFKEFGYYVFGMPVTSLENRIRGNKIWGLPKVVEEVDIFEKDGDCVTTAKDESGVPYFELRVPMKGKTTEFDVTSNLYSRLDNRLLKSETNFKASFNVTKYMNLLWKKDQKPNRSYLTIGDTSFAKVLKYLEIEEHPFQLRYAEHMNSCFDLPDPPKFSIKVEPKIVMFGSGAVGGSVGAWVASNYEHVYFLDQGEIADTIKSKGITHYKGDEKDKKETVSVKVIDDLNHVPDADVIVIGVKNYSLDAVAKMIKDKVGDKPIIVAMQNGVENQEILPKYFSKVIYCIVSYNAWMDEPVVIGYQKKGPLVFGTLNNELQAEMKEIAGIFGKGVETVITPHVKDAAHSKMIINLTNSLTTLIGHPQKEISSLPLFQKLLSNLTYEGVQIVKAAGYKECKLGGMPPWAVITASAKLPRRLTRGIFKKNVDKMVMSSMAQDILQRKGSESELESLNGYFLKLADEHGLKVPYNRAIYALCKDEFGKPDFVPMDVKEVWKKVKKML